jgi:competence CoiA-like predicted nuclease
MRAPLSLTGPCRVALVPKGKLGGQRRPHFDHPPGMAPPGGSHSPETVWHAEGKQRLARLAQGRGAQARVEAYTPGGRRRSDVAIIMPDGRRVAIEVQLGEISDAQWQARHEDYNLGGVGVGVGTPDFLDLLRCSALRK